MTDPVRLSKHLAELAGCSRREAELYIQGGWVKVDGEVVVDPLLKVQQPRIELHPQAELTPIEPVTLILHLPAAPGEQQRPTPEGHWTGDSSGIAPQPGHLARLRCALDLPAGAGGMQVLTRDWRIHRKLSEEAHKLEQEWVVEVSGQLQENGLRVLNRGFTHQGQALPAAKVSWQNEIRLRFALKNPPPGQIEHMCAAVGLQVVALKRIRIGAVAMGKLPPGAWRYLAGQERF